MRESIGCTCQGQAHDESDGSTMHICDPNRKNKNF